MPVRRPLWRTVGALLAAVAAVGCATSTAQMTPQQREGVELRRYCEQKPGGRGEVPRLPRFPLTLPGAALGRMLDPVHGARAWNEADALRLIAKVFRNSKFAPPR
ncbi:MAG: hypothetical protein U5L05_07630 [Rubrivivax sp.]|nr:hypothetical protein [Rubrivivax sp.]